MSALGREQSLPVLSTSEVEKAKEAFTKFDEDHSGSIDIVSVLKTTTLLSAAGSRNQARAPVRN